MNRSKFIILCLCLAFVLSGCTTTQSGKTTYDPEARTTIVTGKESTLAPLMGAVRTIFLNAEISPGETGLYLLVLYLSVHRLFSPNILYHSSTTRLLRFR